MSRYNRVRGEHADPNNRVLINDASMHNGLMSTEDTKDYDQCCGIHGAMRERRGAKRATSAARRRRDKVIVQQGMEDLHTTEEETT